MAQRYAVAPSLLQNITKRTNFGMEAWIEEALKEFEPRPQSTSTTSNLHPELSAPASDDNGEPAPKRQKVENN